MVTSSFVKRASWAGYLRFLFFQLKSVTCLLFQSFANIGIFPRKRGLSEGGTWGILVTLTRIWCGFCIFHEILGKLSKTLCTSVSSHSFIYSKEIIEHLICNGELLNPGDSAGNKTKCLLSWSLHSGGEETESKQIFITCQSRWWEMLWK